MKKISIQPFFYPHSLHITKFLKNKLDIKKKKNIV